MRFLRTSILSLFTTAAILSASADKMSPDTRIFVERQNRESAVRQVAGAETPVQVFISVEDGFDAGELRSIPGLEVQSVFNNVVTARALPSALEQLCAIEQVRYIQKASGVHLLNNFGRKDLHVDEVHANTGNTLPQAYTGRGVIVGLIDTGVEYGHNAYYNGKGGTLRIRRVWDQNTFAKNPPEGYTYGSEYTTQEAILEAATDSKTQFHGSHTMGTAAGGGNLSTPYTGMAPDADIVFVSFATNSNASIADGIKYIFDYADEVDKPCVINMSLGSHQGPHDGTSALDRVIDEMTGPGRIIVGAVGNEGEAHMHASKTFTETDRTMKTFITFSAQQYEKRQYLDIWGTPGSNLKVSLGVFNSLKGQMVDQSQIYDTSNSSVPYIFYFTYLEEVGAEVDATINGEINPDNGAPHVWIESQVGDVGQGRMPGLIIEGDPGATVHVWNVGMNEFSSNGKKGFTDGDANCTVGEIGGTAKSIITVGSYDGRNNIPFRRNNVDYYMSMLDQESFPYKQYSHSTFSSYGPTADGRIVPHVLAPGLPVISCLNRFALSSSDLEDLYSDCTTTMSGHRSYYIYSMGTSMSAPHVAGIVALMLQANPELTPQQAREILQSTADTWDEMGALPNNAYGAGRANALKAVRAALELGGWSSVEEIAVDSDATRVWGADGQINVMTPAVGSTLRLYSLTGQLLDTIEIRSTTTAIDASKWGKTIIIAELEGGASRKTFKITI